MLADGVAQGRGVKLIGIKILTATEVCHLQPQLSSAEIGISPGDGHHPQLVCSAEQAGVAPQSGLQIGQLVALDRITGAGIIHTDKQRGQILRLLQHTICQP